MVRSLRPILHRLFRHFLQQTALPLLLRVTLATRHRPGDHVDKMAAQEGVLVMGYLST
jgi:hypothetical protein